MARTHQGADRPTAVASDKGLDTISSFSYELDAVDNRTQVLDNAGATDYGYGDLHRLRTLIDADSQL